MSVFRPIATPECLNHSNDLSTLLKACLDQREVYEMGKQRIRGNEKMAARNQNSKRQPGKRSEKPA
jgi:hypothetical protein